MKKNQTSRWTIWLAIVAVLSIILSACAPVATPVSLTEQPVSQPVEKQLVVARDMDLDTLDPHHAWSGTGQIVIKAMYDQLTNIDPNDPSKVLPYLATEWTISEDALTYTFKIREGVKFHSGNILTSEDVRFSIARMKNLKGSPAFLLDGMESVEAPDASTVVVKLVTPDASFLSKMSCQYMGIIDSKVAKEHGATDAVDADTTDTAQAWLDENSAGSGPFILESWTRNQDIRWVAFKDYWNGAADVDSVIMRDIKDITTQRQQLERGDIDIAMNIDPDTAKELQSNPNVVIKQQRGYNQVYIGLTGIEANNKDLATNQKLRQAISYAIDYDGLINFVLAGNAERAATIVVNGFLGADKVEPIQRDLTKAKQLMDEAGFPNGIDLDIFYPNATYYGVDFSVVIQKVQSDLAEIGVRLNPNPLASTVYLPKYKAGKLSMVLSYWEPDWMDTSTLIDSFATPTSLVAKRLGYVNEENGVLSAQALIETDPEKRAEIYGQIEQNMIDDAHLIGMIQPNVVLAYSAKVSNYIYNPAYTLDLYSIHKED